MTVLLQERTHNIQPMADDIVSRIIEGRQSLGLTTSELARLAGLDYPTLYRIEKGDRQPALSSVQKLARALNMTTSELLGEHKIALFVDPAEMRLGQRLAPLITRLALSDLFVFLSTLASLSAETQGFVERTVRALAAEQRKSGSAGARVLGEQLHEDAAGYHVDETVIEERERI